MRINGEPLEKMDGFRYLGWQVNVLEMKCLRSIVEVSRMDRVRNEYVC